MPPYRCEDCNIQLKFIGVATINKWKYQCPKCYKIVLRKEMHQKNMEYLFKRPK